MPEPKDSVRIGIIGNIGTVSHFEGHIIENIDVYNDFATIWKP